MKSQETFIIPEEPGQRVIPAASGAEGDFHDFRRVHRAHSTKQVVCHSISGTADGRTDFLEVSLIVIQPADLRQLHAAAAARFQSMARWCPGAPGDVHNSALLAQRSTRARCCSFIRNRDSLLENAALQPVVDDDFQFAEINVGFRRPPSRETHPCVFHERKREDQMAGDEPCRIEKQPPEASATSRGDSRLGRTARNSGERDGARLPRRDSSQSTDSFVSPAKRLATASPPPAAERIQKRQTGENDNDGARDREAVSQDNPSGLHARHLAWTAPQDRASGGQGSALHPPG